MLPPTTASFESSNGHATATAPANGRGKGALVPARHELPTAIGPVGAHAIGLRRPQPTGPRFDASALLHSLRRRLPIALSAGVVFATGAAALLWLLVPVKSEVEAYLRVKSAPPVLVEATSTDAGRQGNEFDIFRKTQVATIKSPIVLAAALREPAISGSSMLKSEKDPVKFLESEINVDFPGEAEIMRISLQGEHPAEMVAVVNAVVDTYMQNVADNEKKNKSGSYDTLVRLAEKMRDDIRKESENYQRLAELVSTTSQTVIETEQRLMHERISGLNGLLTQLKTKRMDLETDLETLRQVEQEYGGDSVPDYAVQQELAKDPNYAQMQAELQMMQSQLRAARQTSNPEKTPPYVQRLEENVQSLETEIESYTSEQWAAIETMLKGGANLSIGSQIRNVQRQIEMLDQRVNDEASSLNRMEERLKKLGANSPELEQSKRKIEQLEISYHKVTTEVSSMNVELQAPPRVDVLQPAVPPESDNSSLKVAMAGFAWIFTFGLVAFGIAYWEMQAARVNHEADVSDSLGIKVVGGMPGLGGRLGRRGVNDALVEAVDGLRTLLMHHAGLDGTRVVLVTSAGPREGKTTLATQLAASLARAGRRTLLLDGDLRNPTAHRLFEMPLDPGFCEVLRGQADVDDVVCPTRIPGLWMLSAGRCDLECLHELAKDGVAAIFERLRLDFDFVIVDSGPVLAVTDALLLGKLADTTILSVLRDVSRAPQVQQAHQMMERVGIHVMGTVVQGVQKDQETRRHKLPLQLTS